MAVGVVYAMLLIGFHLTTAHNYCKICAKHTMCVHKGVGKACGRMLASGVDVSDRREILKVHNILRQKVAVGRQKDQPPAADMHLMVWDKELAKVAQRWANQCTIGNDVCRDVSRYSVGQNILSTHSTSRRRGPEWTKAIASWYNEVKHWRPDHIQPFKPISATANFTQLIWARSKNIGCGYSAFRKGGAHSVTKLYVCNYGPRGNIKGAALYTKGGACAACPPHNLRCAYGLCAKGRKACRWSQPVSDPCPLSPCPVGTFSYCGRCVSLVNIHRFCSYKVATGTTVALTKHVVV